ncbi:3'-5' exonuclease [Lutimaribacter marinistellae]|uniref:DNA 3'-5' helicase n=1 Tax=Lutimaribacter marinistellae TaxID=1820329 RepID=A0ABV7TIY8_9RHOB
MTEWTLSLRKNFQSELLALPPKENAQIQKKLSQLVEDPLPDAKVKKQLKNWKGGNVYRLRSGDYRIFYAIDEPYISLLALRRRSEDTYDEEIAAVNFGGPGDTDLEMSGVDSRSSAGYWEAFALEQSRAGQRRLPSPLTDKLLDRLFVPKELQERLLDVQTEEELLDCPGVNDELLLRIHEAIFEKPLREVLDQPEFVAESVEDLFRFKAGDLPGFLLKLSPGQQALVDFNIDGTKPTLVKGGPGSGKSTVALYRAAEIVRRAAEAGKKDARVLFTTYTNALTNVSTSLLRTLLPGHSEAVVVKTADSLVKEIIEAAGLRFAPANETQMRDTLRHAMTRAAVGSNALEKQRNRDALTRFSESYLLDEVCSVVLAQGLRDLESYLDHPRHGRREPLSTVERELVWSIAREFSDALSTQSLQTWSELRVEAARLVESGRVPLSFDAVIVDEVQDLEPAMIVLLSNISVDRSSLFLTADGGQSIYRSTFAWTEVLRTLGIEAKISDLPGNYRSTEQIDAAAKSYLGTSDLRTIDERYAHDGPMPVHYIVDDEESEARVVSQFVSGASSVLRLSQSSCAILVPARRQGQAIAERLRSTGLPAEFSTGRDLDISSDSVKILPFQSAKGLEFPVVVIAGLWPPTFPFVPTGASSAELAELEDLQRRTLYVAMTRAMRALMVVQPRRQRSKLLSPFKTGLWTVKT